MKEPGYEVGQIGIYFRCTRGMPIECSRTGYMDLDEVEGVIVSGFQCVKLDQFYFPLSFFILSDILEMCTKVRE